MTEQNLENAYMFRLRREGIETKVVTEHRESETEDPTRRKLFRQATQNSLSLLGLFDGDHNSPIITSTVCMKYIVFNKR